MDTSTSSAKAQAWYQLRALLSRSQVQVRRDIALWRSLQASGHPVVVGVDLAPGPDRSIATQLF